MLKKQLFLLIFLVSLSNLTIAQQDDDAVKYIERFNKVAMEEMIRFKIPASITLAQGILESGNGKSRLATKANNHFGIKCKGGWTGDKIYHDDDEDDECFRVYPSPWGSYRDHSKFLKDQPRYSFLFDYKITDYKSWAKGLKSAGYATDRKYPERLIGLIEKYQLYRYDQMVLNGVEIDENEILALTTHQIVEHKNRLDYILIKEGDTYSSLKLELGIRPEKLMKYNDKTYDSPLVAGEVIFLERKRTYGYDKTYTVKQGDTMYSIAQSQGIRLEYLYKRNNLDYGTQAEVGTTLLLKKYK